MELIFSFILSFVFSFFLPFIWVYFFYLKDPNSEPFLFLFFAFLLGILAGVFSYFIEGFLLSYLNLEKYSYLYQLLSALFEEFFKYILVAIFIFPLAKVVDEPIDFMIYMFFSAFGFAFIENFGFLITSEKDFIYYIAFFRFLGANFLHILASGLIGYGCALSYQTRRVLPLISFFLSASFLHFFYNLVIINSVLNSKEFLGYFLIIPILWLVFFIILVELKYFKLNNGRRN